MCGTGSRSASLGEKSPLMSQMGSPQLISHGNQWWLHTPIEKQFKSPGKIEKQVTTNAQTKICSVDLNINEHLAVCTVRTVEGSILATTFLSGGRRVNGLRRATARTNCTQPTQDWHYRARRARQYRSVAQDSQHRRASRPSGERSSCPVCPAARGHRVSL